MFKNLFIRWYFNEFKYDQLYHMLTTVSEHSPWHREGNTAIHTNMVVAEYLAMDHPEWGRDQLLGALACAFHDVGKPTACQKNGMRFKPERGNYLSFGGHEQISARLWEDYAVRNWTRLTELFQLHPHDIYTIGWIIEHHLPWGVKKTDKVNQIALTSMFATEPEVFTNVLLADTLGRISDDEVEKRAKVSTWIENFLQNVVPNVNANDTEPENDQSILTVPVGVSGAGKSSFTSRVDEHTIFSWDILRTEWYGDDSEKAFQASTRDKNFKKKSNAIFLEMVKSGENVYIDNTNLGKKIRAFFIQEARRRGYFIRAILFPIDMQTCRDRQSTRTDKSVPIDSVDKQYMALQYPQYGEFDDVKVVSLNLPEFS